MKDLLKQKELENNEELDMKYREQTRDDVQAVWLNKELHTKLKMKCVEEGKPMTDVVNRLVDNYLK